jgi:hypothetical protein
MKTENDRELAPMLVAKGDAPFLIDGMRFTPGESRIRADHVLVYGHEEHFEELPEAEQVRYRTATTRVLTGPLAVIDTKWPRPIQLPGRKN